MTYKCPQCVQTAEQIGNCPDCNVPMNEEVAPANEEATPETTQPQEPEADSKE